MHATHAPSRQHACSIATGCTLNATLSFILFDTKAGDNDQCKWCMVTAVRHAASSLCRWTLVTAGLSLDLLVDKWAWQSLVAVFGRF